MRKHFFFLRASVRSKCKNNKRSEWWDGRGKWEEKTGANGERWGRAFFGSCSGRAKALLASRLRFAGSFERKLMKRRKERRQQQEEEEQQRGRRRPDSPGAKRRLDRTGNPALSQCPAGGGTRAEPGLPHRHLTARWWPRTWPCHFLAGRRFLSGRLSPPFVPGASWGLNWGFPLLWGVPVWAPG